MDDILTLGLISFAMLIGCYLAGIIPLAVSLSEEKLKFVTVLGAGLLVGTALAVIIPEGIHAMYSMDVDHHHEHPVEKAAEVKAPVVEVQLPVEVHKEHAHDLHKHSHGIMDNHSIIGVALVAGFIFMLLVDQIGGGAHMHSPPDTEAGSQTVTQHRGKITATLGLVVHAAADGVAMGAAVSMKASHITMIVFVAIMLHKAPAAFGLVSFLLHDGFDRPRIRKHLFVFAASAPVMAILTYICLNLNGFESFHNVHTTGIAMLFSAGTFLYVATVHVLPEISTTKSKQIMANGTVIEHEHKGFRKTDLVAIVLGAVLPVILTIGHSH